MTTLKRKGPEVSARSRQRDCADCGSERARLYEQRSLGEVGEISTIAHLYLCAPCARGRRGGEQSAGHRASRREELMAELEVFYAESGVLEICARCHEQGTGCCPPTCRSLTPAGCRRKTLWCASFICGALLNAIAECDQETARRLKWLKREVGPAEYRLFEIFSRTPREQRDEVRPIVIEGSLPRRVGLGEAKELRAGLIALMEEVLEVRRAWREREEAEFEGRERGQDQVFDGACGGCGGRKK